ncbi:MAG: MCE family protein [Rhodobacteraceae bacterium]|nr:MCE family protein [Paracoccaceae bacterium]
METRANYVIIGAFITAVLIGAFSFVYWLAATAESRENVFLKIIFPAPVTGLTIGGQVLFNGIKVGDVSALDFDRNNPEVVVATVRVKPDTPLRKDTTAALNFTGLTGVAYVDLNGGTVTADPLLNPQSDQTPVIYAARSMFDDIVGGASEVLGSAGTTMESIDNFLKKNGPALSRTVENVETFTGALASNSEGVETFMASVASVSTSIGKLSERMEGLVVEGERILAAVPSDKVESIVGDISKFSTSLGDASKGINKVVLDIEGAAADIQLFTQKLNGGLDDIEKIVQAIDPEQVARVVKGAASVGDVLDKRSADLDQAIGASNKALQNIAEVSDTIRAHSDDIDIVLTESKAMIGNVGQMVARSTEVVSAIEPAKVANIVTSVETVTAGLANQKDSIDATLSSARQAAEGFASMTAELQKSTPDVKQVIADAREMSATLNATAVRVQAIVEKVDTMVEGDSEGFFTEATKAASSIRKIADTFEKQADSIAGGLSRFANKGSSDFSAAMAELNRTLVKLQRAVDSFDRNPSRVIFGGEEVPTYTGGKRR